MRELTVKDLVAALSKQPPTALVKVWLPGSTISLTGIPHRDRHGVVLIEGNVDEGSVIRRLLEGE